MDSVQAVILAGGQGERLGILSKERAKPAVPFAGNYRIVDYTISNCANSAIKEVVVLTQYNPLSLAEHIGVGAPWGLVPPDKQIRLLQPYLAREQGRDWYKGTADAVYQNLRHIDNDASDLIFILSGDHVYKMDYSEMVRFHREKQAEISIAVTPFPDEELNKFGTVTIDESSRITGFQEKVKNPKSHLVSMGIYLFNAETLHKWLATDAANNSSKHDFGRSIFPKMLNKAQVFAYHFEGYWRDVGTIHTYWQTNMDLLEMTSTLLSSPDWPIRTNEIEHPPTKISKTADVTNCLISSGCIIEGNVEHSILSPGVRVAKGAIVRDSIIMADTIIGRGSIVDYSILDKEVVVETDCRIGFGDDFTPNRKDPNILNTGITLVGRKAHIGYHTRIGRNCMIEDGVRKEDFPSADVESGTTIKPLQNTP